MSGVSSDNCATAAWNALSTAELMAKKIDVSGGSDELKSRKLHADWKIVQCPPQAKAQAQAQSQSASVSPPTLSRKYKHKNFVQAMQFVNQVADLAEKVGM